MDKIDTTHACMYNPVESGMGGKFYSCFRFVAIAGSGVSIWSGDENQMDLPTHVRLHGARIFLRVYPFFSSLSRQQLSLFHFSFLWHAYVIPILGKVPVPIMIPVLGVPRM